MENVIVYVEPTEFDEGYHKDLFGNIITDTFREKNNIDVADVEEFFLTHFKGCERCIDCVFCIDCEDCEHCINCVDCGMCYKCMSCSNCKSCNICEDCHHLSLSDKCHSVFYGEVCFACSFCTRVFGCDNEHETGFLDCIPREV